MKQNELVIPIETQIAVILDQDLSTGNFDSVSAFVGLINESQSKTPILFDSEHESVSQFKVENNVYGSQSVVHVQNTLTDKGPTINLVIWGLDGNGEKTPEDSFTLFSFGTTEGRSTILRKDGFREECTAVEFAKKAAEVVQDSIVGPVNKM